MIHTDIAEKDVKNIIAELNNAVGAKGWTYNEIADQISQSGGGDYTAKEIERLLKGESLSQYIKKDTLICNMCELFGVSLSKPMVSESSKKSMFKVELRNLINRFLSELIDLIDCFLQDSP